MDKRREEYTAYYKSRMLKYKGNPAYKNSYESEKALYEAIANSATLEEFGEKLKSQKLNIKNAAALIKDREALRAELYESEKEFVRLEAPKRILDVIDGAGSETEIVNTVNDIETDVSKKITVDLFTDEFYGEFMTLENIEVYENAEVPDEWKHEINVEHPAEMISEGRKSWTEHILPNARQWDENWNFDFNLIWEERHRRKIPVSDELVKKRIEQFKKYRGI